MRKNQYGHGIGSLAATIDDLLIAGSTLDGLKSQKVWHGEITPAWFFRHINHLLKKHGVSVSNKGGFFKIANTSEPKVLAPVAAAKVISEVRPEVMDNGYVKPSIFDKVMKAVKAGMTPVVFGPAGCGKSRMAKEIALVLKKPFYCLSFSGGLRYSQVFGSQSMKNNETKWTPAPLLEWVQTKCLILLDEIFSADPEVLLGLNSLLESDSRSISTPIGTIKVHPECSFIAAANSNGRQQSRQYTGAVRSDDSLLDRLIPPFNMGYDERAEATIVRKLVDDTTASLLLGTLSRLRGLVKEKGVAFDPSTRRLIGACKMVNAGFETKEAFNLSFLSTLSQAELSQINPL